MNGATIGATPNTSMIAAKIRGISAGEKRSRTAARDVTPPAQAASACTSRAPIRTSALFVSAQAAHAAI